MTAAESARRVLVDAFGRVDEHVTKLTDGLTLDESTWQVDPGANTIGWLLWHSARVQDAQVASITGNTQVWEEWRERFGVPFPADATGYGQSIEDVRAVRVDAEQLADYHRQVHQASLTYLDGLTEDELARIVDERWDPPVTAAARLISIVDDEAQHLGSAAYLRGVYQRQQQGEAGI